MKTICLNGSPAVRVALITGGTKGIGRAAAVALARSGVQVVVTYNTDVFAASLLVREIGQDKCQAMKSDASKIEEMEALVGTMVETYGHIDILITNAGWSPFMNFENVTESDFDRTFALNVKGPFFLAQKAAPHMPPGSSVILVSSTLCADSRVLPDKLLYCSTKGAIEQMARLLARSMGVKGIAVNALAPGPTATEQFYIGKPEHIVKTIAAYSPYDRIGTAEEVARAFLFLSDSNNQWMTGQTVRINGGSA